MDGDIFENAPRVDADLLLLIQIKRCIFKNTPIPVDGAIVRKKYKGKSCLLFPRIFESFRKGFFTENPPLRLKLIYLIHPNLFSSLLLKR